MCTPLDPHFSFCNAATPPFNPPLVLPELFSSLPGFCKEQQSHKAVPTFDVEAPKVSRTPMLNPKCFIQGQFAGNDTQVCLVKE